MSRVGSADIAGFTLLELLVVLLIIGLVGASIPGFLLRDRNGLELENAARAVREGLHRTRSEAMLTNREKRFALDVDARQFVEGRSATPRQISPKIDLAFRTARSERLTESSGAIRFFPDGSATGGVIALSEGAERRLIEIDWLTGLITETSDAP